MPDIGVPELLIIAVIVLLLFGPAKAADLGGALGKSIREFRRASTDDGDANTPVIGASAAAPVASSAPTASASVAASVPRTGKFCTSCGSAVAGDQRFCINCGAPRAGG